MYKISFSTHSSISTPFRIVDILLACHQHILKYSTFLESCSVPSLLCRCMKNSFVGSGIDKVIAISASITIQLHYLFGEILWNGAGGVKLREIIAILSKKFA